MNSKHWAHAYRGARLAGVLLMLQACISAQVGTRFPIENVPSIKRCQTTQANLLQLLGNPYQRGAQSGYNTLRWLHQRASVRDSTQNDLIVFLNDAGVVVDYTLNPQGSLVKLYDRCGAVERQIDYVGPLVITR
jgi:hypothetical protein